MIFSSVEFFVFLALLLVAVGLTRRETPRRVVLIAASYLFYAWSDWRACFLLLGVDADRLPGGPRDGRERPTAAPGNPGWWRASR